MNLTDLKNERALDLTAREEELMNFLWSWGEPITSGEILDRCTDRSWCDSYLYVMLRSLTKKGLIERCGAAQYGTKLAYLLGYTVTREEYFVAMAFKRSIDKKLFAQIAASVAESGEDLLSKAKKTASKRNASSKAATPIKKR